MCVVDYAREYKELFKLFIMFGFVESERMTIARFKSGLRYEIKKEMSHKPLEDVEDAIETAVQFEKYVKFKKKSMVYVDALFFHICHVSPCEWWNVKFIV